MINVLIVFKCVNVVNFLPLHAAAFEFHVLFRLATTLLTDKGKVEDYTYLVLVASTITQKSAEALASTHRF